MVWPFWVCLFRKRWQAVYIYLVIYLCHIAACGVLIPWPGIEPMRLAVEVQTLDHQRIPNMVILENSLAVSHTLTTRPSISTSRHVTQRNKTYVHTRSYRQMIVAALPITVKNLTTQYLSVDKLLDCRLSTQWLPLLQQNGTNYGWCLKALCWVK